MPEYRGAGMPDPIRETTRHAITNAEETMLTVLRTLKDIRARQIRVESKLHAFAKELKVDLNHALIQESLDDLERPR